MHARGAVIRFSGVKVGAGRVMRAAEGEDFGGGGVGRGLWRFYGASGAWAWGSGCPALDPASSRIQELAGFNHPTPSQAALQDEQDGVA